MFTSLATRSVVTRRSLGCCLTTTTTKAAATLLQQQQQQQPSSWCRWMSVAVTTAAETFPQGPVLTSLNEHFHPTQDHFTLRDMLRDYVAHEVSRSRRRRRRRRMHMQ
eukprot:scaffold8235_cov155-Amphora_coffeaeformis.AAC.2